MWGTPILLLSLLTAPAAEPPVRCVLAGTLTFTPALADTPVPVRADLTGHLAECSDPQVAYADVSARLTGQAGRRSARLAGTTTYTWHLRSGRTTTSTQTTTGIGVGTAFGFEGPITAGRYNAHDAEITPLVPAAAPDGPLNDIPLFARLRIRP
jgi:hypothetical protein